VQHVGGGSLPPGLGRPDSAGTADAGSEEDDPEDRPERPIETDRDSFTPSTRTVETGWFVLESSYSFLDERHVPPTHSFPELLLRYGLLERLELRLGWNYEVGGASGDVSGSGGEGFVQGAGVKRDSRVSYGLKAGLTEQQGWVPQSAFILQALTPTTGETTATQLVATYVFGWELANRWKLDAAFRYEAANEAGDHFDVWAPSVVLKVPLGQRWSVHGEYFGLFSSGKQEEFVLQYFSPGVHFLVTPNLEVGTRIGFGLTEQSARFFSNVGVGWRF
jgi:hypothetical protein